MIALIEKEDSQIRILSPAVGFYSEMPRENTFIGAGALIGKLTVLNSAFPLYLPEKVSGVVIYSEMPDRIAEVEYGEELFRLSADQLEISHKVSGADKNRNNSDFAEDGFVVRAFTTGIFYRRPSPDASPYVEEGQQIENGKVLGLIEVMKTFNHVIFHGTEKSKSGVIKKILIEDGQEVKLNQPLFVIG